MAELHDVQDQLNAMVPFNRVLGIQVAAIAPEQVDVSLPVSPDQANHVGTVHAAAQFGLGEAASGAMLFSAFQDLILGGVVPLAVHAEISYRHPATGDLLASASLSTDEQRRIREEVTSGGRSSLTIPVQITNAEGTQVSDLRVDWLLRALRQSEPTS